MNEVSVRTAAVAGLFYPASGAELRHVLSSLLPGDAGTEHTPPKLLIVPHAGYVYSGPVAAEAYRYLAGARERIRRVVLLGPAHRVYLEGLAVPSTQAFATPLGRVALDSAALARVAAMPGVSVSDAAHRDEHSLEVQLPFLQTLLDDFELVPLVVGRAPPAQVAAVLDALWGGPETLVVISTDLSHYLPYRLAQSIDATTCERILAHEAGLSGEEACGAAVLNGLMQSRHGRELALHRVDLRNSGDTAGDRDRVVGYGAFVAH